MQVELNIDNYLSEEEKKELVIDVFKQRIREELFNSNKGTIQSDSEVQRIIGNITHQIVFNEIQEYIPDAKEKIKAKVKKILNTKDLNYEVFKKKDAWDRDESLAVKYINESVKENEEMFKNRIKDTMANYDLKQTLTDEVSGMFDKLANTMYGLSELFHNNNKN